MLICAPGSLCIHDWFALQRDSHAKLWRFAVLYLIKHFHKLFALASVGHQSSDRVITNLHILSHEPSPYSWKINHLCVFIDESNITCDIVPRGRSQYTELIWTYPRHGSSVDLFRVVLSGTQPCHSINTSWFIRGGNSTCPPSECEVKESRHGDFRVCFLTCRCVAPGTCGYLHFRVQFVPWMTTSLAMCHFVGFVNPELYRIATTLMEYGNTNTGAKR